MSTTIGGVRIVDMPDLGAVTDDSSVVGEHAGSGRFSVPALRSYTIGNRGLVTPYDYGAVGSTATVWHDDTAALNTAFSQIGVAGGGRIYIPGIFYAAGALTVPPNVEIYGNFTPCSQQYTPSVSYFQVGGSKLILGPSGMSLGKSDILRNIMVIAAGLPTTNPTNPTEGHALINTMATNGTGVTLTGDNCLIDSVQVLGFNYGVYCVGNPACNRQMLRNIHGDCTNPIWFSTGGDMCHIIGAHLWPYLTCTVVGDVGGAGSTGQRSGTGIYTKSNGGSIQVAQCMVYGWQTCYMADTNSVTWVQCWADGNAPQSTGFASTGACGVLQLCSCSAVANQIAVHHSPSNGATFNINAGCSLGAGGPGGTSPTGLMSVCVWADGHGPVQCIGAYFTGGQAAFYLGPNSGSSIIIGNVYDDAGSGFDHLYSVDAAVLPLLTKHSNRIINSTRSFIEQAPGTPGLGGVTFNDQMPNYMDFLAGLQSNNQISIQGTGTSTASYRIYVGGAPLDQKEWDWFASSTDFVFRALKDDHTATTTWLDVSRTGYTVTNIRLIAADIWLSGAVGFNGNTPIAKPAITGSRAGNAALGSLLAQLAAYGLITDSSSA